MGSLYKTSTTGNCNFKAKRQPKTGNNKPAMYFQILITIGVMASLEQASAQDMPKPICETSCGNVTIEYPFGSGEGCYYDSNFLITCNRSSGEPIPFFGNAVVTNFSVSESEMEIMMFVAHDCYNRSGRLRSNTPSLKLADFRISTKNKFIAIGCDTRAYVGETGENETFGTGCISRCDSNNYVPNGSCSGVGCCQTPIPEGMRSFTVSLSSYRNHTNILDFNPCSHGFVVKEDKFSFSSINLRDFESVRRMPMLLDWAIGNITCDVARKNMNSFQCQGNSECDPDYKGPGYRCKCLNGYAGNPYIANSCTDIKECNDPNNDCEYKDKCTETPGNYTCSCPKGYYGDGRKGGTGCIAKQSLVMKITISTSTAVTGLLICIIWLYLGFKKRKLMMLKEKFFRQNGGIMLQQRISGSEGSHDAAKVFTMEELKKATNNYDERRIIGKGGYGTVYKGVLSDERTVAIKKSKQVDQTQIEQFINEVVILSQINHRNVVKLLGCCLETEVPMLVYEFIPNGTLSDHVHNESKSLALTWDIRLRIAAETAGALSYLHSAASIPIIHRDVKPTNILLDQNYVAKVSDFGASRLIPMDQIELATIVQGTLGYLDPEYLHTSQLTEKSDVYSFGVVLVELLTGKKVVSFDRPEEERNLAMYFLSCLNKGQLSQVLDNRIMPNEDASVIIEVSRLAERCLSLKGEERPAMKEVAMELEGILGSMIQKHPWVKTTSNEEETEYLLKDPINDHESKDGASRENTAIFDSINNHILIPIDSGR